MTLLHLCGRPVLYRHGHYHYCYCYCYSKSDAASARPTNGLSSTFLIRLPYTRDYATPAERGLAETYPSCVSLPAPSASASATPASALGTPQPRHIARSLHPHSRRFPTTPVPAPKS